MQLDFLTPKEVRALGLRSYGRRVLIRRTARLVDPDKISLGDNVIIDDFSLLYGGSGIDLQGHNHIGAYGALFGRAGIVMEPFAGTAPRVSIFSESDDYSGRSLTNPTVSDAYKPGLHSEKVQIGRHVIIGANASVLPGCEIGEGCAIGAYSLVTADLEPWGIYAGVPAKRKAERDKALLELEARLDQEGQTT